MLHFYMRVPVTFLKYAALWAVVASAFGQESQPPPATSTPAPAVVPLPPSQPPPPERSWRIGAAFGYGQRTNPLIQSEDIPVIVDLDIAWFGKRWFFDNGDAGFTLFDRPQSTTSLVARVNDDRVFFGKTNTRYVNFAYAGNGATLPIFDPQSGAQVDTPVEVVVPDRDYAIELGVESLIDGRWGGITLSAFHDVSDTHGGYELSAHYSWRWIAGRFSLSPTVGVSYKSEKLNDYYWGVQEDEANVALPEYHPRDGMGYEGGLVASYHFTRNLRFAVSFNYERLAEENAASPLAEEDHVTAWFSGLAWTF